MKTQSWYESCLVLVVSVFIARVQTIPERRVWAKSGHPEKPRRATGAQGDPGRAKSLRYEVMPAPRGAVAELGPADQEQSRVVLPTLQNRTWGWQIPPSGAASVQGWHPARAYEPNSLSPAFVFGVGHTGNVPRAAR